MVEVVEWNLEDFILVMEKIEPAVEFFKAGEDQYEAWRHTANRHDLWKVCIEWRARTVKAYFEFAVVTSQNDGFLCSDNKFFYHTDGRPHNVLMRNNQPVFIDPDSFR